MKKIFILVICLITAPAIACAPGNSPDSGAAPSAAAPSAAPAPAAPSAAAPSASPAAAVGGMADGGAGVDQADFLPTVEPDCKWIIWGKCVNPVVGEDHDWLVDGEPWYKVIKKGVSFVTPHGA